MIVAVEVKKCAFANNSTETLSIWTVKEPRSIILTLSASSVTAVGDPLFFSF